MSTSVRLASAIMLIPGSIWAGIIVCYAVERTNLWRRMPIEQYTVDFRRSLHRVDPLQPILLMISAAGTIWFATSVDGNATTFAWLGLAGLLIVMVTSIGIAEPMNTKFRKLSEGQVPEGAEQIRTRWSQFHLFRTVVTLATLPCLVLGLTYA